jgi:hypothetical protein
MPLQHDSRGRCSSNLNVAGSLPRNLRSRANSSRVPGALAAENGQIKLLRESLNPIAVAQALLPGGVKDLADPEKVIFSVSPD